MKGQHAMTKKTTAIASAVKKAFEPSAENLKFSASIVTQLDGLIKRRIKWEATEYKKSNDALYALLGDASGIYKTGFVEGSKSDQKTLRMELVTRLKADGIKVQTNTTTLTMLTRFVFGSDRKRAHGYATVLLAAAQENIDPKKLPNWIKEQGGIEEIKRNMIKSEEALKRQEERKAATLKVKGNAEKAVLKPIGLTELMSHGKYGEYAVLVGKPNEKGVIRIVAALANANKKLVESLYKQIAKETLLEDKEDSALDGEVARLRKKKPANDSTAKVKQAA